MPQTTDRDAQRRVLSSVVRDRRGGRMGRMLGAVSADAQMLGAISADIAHAADPRNLARGAPAADPFELRDPDYIARLLHLHQLLRIDVAPVQIAPPWGVTVLDLPGRLPLPAKISIKVLPPIDLRKELGGDRDPDKGYKLVTGRMQDALRDLDEARALPLIG